MKKILFTIALILLTLFSCIGQTDSTKTKSQNDTIIHRSIGTWIYSQKYKIPIIVNYHLHNGGGPINRNYLNFKYYKYTAKNDDYLNSHYDRGHNMPAEDFAFDSLKLKETMEAFNLSPQTHKYNAGVWYLYECKVREYSKIEPINVIILNIVNPNTFIGDNVHKTLNQYKICQSIKTKKIIFCVKFFDYGQLSTVEDIDITDVQKLIHIKLPLIH